MVLHSLWELSNRVFYQPLHIFRVNGVLYVLSVPTCIMHHHLHTQVLTRQASVHGYLGCGHQQHAHENIYHTCLFAYIAVVSWLRQCLMVGWFEKTRGVEI